MSTTSEHDRWLRRLRAAGEPRARLVCFPPEGANSTFFLHLAQSVGRPIEVVGVQYPGRQERRHEDVLDSVADLADGVVAALARDAAPLALFGHGMGAVVAFETALRLERAHARPVVLIASGSPAPHRQRADTAPRADVGLTRAYADLEHAGRTPAATLLGDRTAARTYAWDPADRLDCPILAMMGDEDRGVTVDEAVSWGEVTGGRFELQVFSGGHFYLTSLVSTVANALSERVLSPFG